MTRLISVNEAAAQLGIGRTKVYELLKQKKIKSLRVGTRRLIPQEVVCAYIEHLIAEGEQ